MKNKTVIVILSAAALLLGFIFFFEKGSTTTRELVERKGRVFVDFKRDAVNHLVVRNTAGVAITIEKDINADNMDEGTWQITAPKKLEADQTEVRAILSAIDFLLSDRVVQGKEHLSDPKFGMLNPRITASFTVRGKTTKLSIGSDAQGEKVYMSTDEQPDRIHAVEHDFFTALDKDLSRLRSKVLVYANLAESIGIEIFHTNTAIKLEREEAAAWKIEQAGVLIGADEDQVRELINTVQELKADEFVADDVDSEGLQAMGLATPTLSFRAELKGGETTALLVGKPCPGADNQVYLTIENSGIVACAKDNFIPVFERPATRLRENRVATFHEDDAAKIELKQGDKTLVLTRESEQWQIDADDLSLEPEAVSNLLGALKETRASKILTGETATAELGTPLCEVKITLTDNAGELSLAIFEGETPETVLVRRADEAALLSVDSALLERTRPVALDYRRRTIHNGETNDVEKIAIKGPTSQELDRKDGAWEVVSPIKLAADNSGARGLAALLAEIEVIRFVASSASADHGLDNPFATLTAGFATTVEVGDDRQDRTGVTEISLELGSDLGNGERYARLRGDDETVFIVGPEYSAKIERPLTARDLFQFDETKLTQLAIKMGETELILDREGDKWSTPNSLAIDTVALSRLTSDLAGMKTVVANSFGTAQPGLDPPTVSVKITISEDGEAEPSVTTVLVGPKSETASENGYLARRSDLSLDVVIPARIVDDITQFVQTSIPSAQ
jgi:uncharacterized protein DUF4340